LGFALLSLAMLMAFSLSDIFMAAMERLPVEAHPDTNSMAADMRRTEEYHCFFIVLFTIVLLLFV
jgi:hypothetical protein